MDESTSSNVYLPGEDHYGEDFEEELDDRSGLDTDDDYDDDDDDDEDEIDSRARFRIATTAMENRHHTFSEPQALYDFLYEFRDVIGLVIEDSNTFLHVALRFINNRSDVRSSNMMPLIQSIVKDHPILLTKRNSDGVTPLYMAISTRKPLLIEAMLSECTEYPEWLTAVQDAIEIPCVEQKAKSCLHIAFQLAIRERVVIKLVTIARNEALSLQDDYGRTPLHYAMVSRRPSSATIRLFIHRDEDILNKRQPESTASSVTFLDIVDKEGNSVYRHHQISPLMMVNKRAVPSEKEVKIKSASDTKKYTNRERQKVPDREREEIDPKRQSINQKLESRRASPREKKVKPKSSPYIGKVATKEILNVLDRAHDEISSKHQISVDRPLEKEKTGLVNANQVIEKKEETERTPKNQAPAEDWDMILKELKSHYMRTRNGIMVESFLYGSNINGQLLQLHIVTEFYIQFSFDYRGLPSKITDRTFIETFSNMKFDEVLQFVSFPDVEVKFTSRHETKMNGKDRRDIKFFFNWLHVKGVRHILRVDVEDSTEFPHSDQAISESFNTITVEQLNWRKVDLDPRVICSLGSKVAWGEAGRISSLTCDCKIREITLTWSGNNTALRAWNNKSIEKKDEDNDGTSKTKDSSDADTDKRNIEIIFVKRGGKGRILENLDTLGQPQPTVESRAAHRWLDSVYAFANRVNQFWMQSLSAIPPSLHDHMASHVVVALIDDGVQAYGSFLSANITGGKSFATGGTNNVASPWYVSELGHGTVMAETIARVCPMVKLYPMRVDTHTSENGEPTLEARSVALAIDAAIQRGAKIILIPWLIEPTKSSSHKLLHSMLQRAHMLDVLLFIPSSAGEGPQALSTFRSYPTFRIGASRDDGGAVNATNSPSEVDFIFPGNEVMIQRDIDNPRRSVGAILDLESSSNINVALAAGLAAVLIYACKLISLKPMSKARSTGEDNDYMNNTYDLTSLRRYRGMMSAFQNLGSVTESRFLKVWEVLDPIVDEMRDSPMENYELKGLIKWFSRLKSIEESNIL
uniref:Peptidase S8/S53 domain-containing protein n=1 Tax=Gibberella zeae (strain ATCC MYA-4620 / CBS 123657 / FGSC 9075 / NRRL 31084 / PH-1) TaxID=229533 RepID=A0A098DD49_GIBZE